MPMATGAGAGQDATLNTMNKASDLATVFKDVGRRMSIASQSSQRAKESLKML